MPAFLIAWDVSHAQDPFSGLIDRSAKPLCFVKSLIKLGFLAQLNGVLTKAKGLLNAKWGHFRMSEEASPHCKRLGCII